MNRKIKMKSRKSVPKWKPKSHSKTCKENTASASNSTGRSSICSVELKPLNTGVKCSSDKLGKLPATVVRKLADSAIGDVEKTLPKTNLAEQTYSSFVSGISDCSSCDQQTKAMNLKSVEVDCENASQQFTNAFAKIAQIAQSPRKKNNDARQIGVQCLEYVNVILYNIEWLERERNQAADQRTQLDENLLQMQRHNNSLKDEICTMQRTNADLIHENRNTYDEFYVQEEHLNMIQVQSAAYRSVVEDHKVMVDVELKKLADSSTQVERAVAQKDVRWDNLNYYLQKRVAELQRDHDQLKVNYDLMCNALRVGNSGDVDNELLDVSVLEAGHEAEMVMMKYAHESFISELNKLNCKLWNEKFYTRSRLEEEIKKHDMYESWLVALKQQNNKYRNEICSLNKQVECLLDSICTKLQSTFFDGQNDKSICFDIS